MVIESSDVYDADQGSLGEPLEGEEGVDVDGAPDAVSEMPSALDVIKLQFDQADGKEKRIWGENPKPSWERVLGALSEVNPLNGQTYFDALNHTKRNSEGVFWIFVDPKSGDWRFVDGASAVEAVGKTVGQVRKTLAQQGKRVRSQIEINQDVSKGVCGPGQSLEFMPDEQVLKPKTEGTNMIILGTFVIPGRLLRMEQTC